MIKVKIINAHQLELEQDAKKGDIIDLSLIESIDSSFLDKALKAPLDEKAKEIESQLRMSFDAEKRAAISSKENELAKEYNEEKDKLKELIHSLQQEKDSFDLKKSKEKKELELEFKEKISQLERDLNQNFEDKRTKLAEEIKQWELKYQQEQSSLKSLEENRSTEIQLAESKVREKLINEFRVKEDELKAEHDKALEELKNKVAELTIQKSSLSTKLLGESLETFCYNEVTSYMENGFLNCQFYKDNEVIKDEDGRSGSKADFIFEIYADKNKLSSQLLFKICLEMKESNPNSVSRVKINHYYPQMFKNMEKKKCKYAVLVSNLEPESPNESPIRRVMDYPNMYVVRPSYLTVFLNMIVSLSDKYAALILQKDKDNQEFISQDQLAADFDKLRESYLDKPLDNLKKHLVTIGKLSDDITLASDKIRKEIEDITTDYLKKIQDKLDRFTIKKLSKKLMALSDA